MISGGVADRIEIYDKIIIVAEKYGLKQVRYYCSTSNVVMQSH